MYCGGKKYSPSSSPSSIISRVFQASWFPKSKQKPYNSPETTNTVTAKTHHRYEPDFPTPTSPVPSFHKEARFYSVDDDDDDDAYWRLSFREQDRKSITSIRYDLDDELHIPVSSYISFGSREIEERQYRDRIMRKHDNVNAEEKQSSPRKNDRHSRNPGIVVERDIFPVETGAEKGCQVSPVSSVEEDYDAFGRVSMSEWQDLEKTSDVQRKSHGRRIKQKNRGSVYSPKREFRVRALEEMKKERMRSRKKETNEQVVEGTTIYDSFAEVINSFDPQKDFRDSMVEMICEKRITRPDELEDLLACYLTLNFDEYHDLIIKVFQEVWFELRWGIY